jgi:hypothetical protein
MGTHPRLYTVLPRLCQPRLCEFLLKNFPMRFGYVNSFVHIFSIISSLRRENKKNTRRIRMCVFRVFRLFQFSIM